MIEFDNLVEQFDELTVGLRKEDCFQLEILAKDIKPGKLHRFWYVAGTKSILPMYFQWPIEFRNWMKLRKLNKYEQCELDCYHMRFYMPFKRFIKCPARVYGIFIFLTCLSIKILTLVTVYILRESNINSWNNYLSQLKKETYPFNTRLMKKEVDEEEHNDEQRSKCLMIETELNSDGKKIINTLDKLNKIYYYFGCPVITSNVTYVFLEIVLITITWFEFAFAWLNQNNSNFRQDSLTLEFEPLIEIRRIRLVTQDIVSTLSSNNHITCNKNDNNNYQNRNRRMSLIFPFYKLTNQQFRIMSNWYIENLTRKRNKEHAQINLARHIHIEPAHFKQKNYFKLINNRERFIRYEIIIMLIISIGIAIGIHWRELTNRVQFRADIIYCKSLGDGNHSFVSKRWPGRMLPEPDPQQSANGVYRPTISSEFGLMFSGQATILSSEFSCGFMMTALLICIYFDLIIANRLILQLWKGQIIEQLRLIKQMMFILERNQKLSSTNNGYMMQNQDKQQQQLIEKCLYEAYINFVLYKRHVRMPCIFLKFVVLHFVIAVIVSSLVLYLCLVKSDNNSVIWLWIIMIFIAFMVNLIGYLCADLTSCFEDLSLHINKLMASVARLSMESTPVVCLWRRQMLNSNEIQDLFGIKMFGVRLSPARLIQFDSHVLAGSFYLLSSFLQRK